MADKASILIVDDNVNLCKTLSLVLKRKGYVITISSNGLDAIERIKKEPFDMVLMDIKMPLLNGVETYRKIKKIRPDTVVLMMTAYAVDKLVQEALQEGVYGIVYKPLDIEKVISIIKKAKNSKQGALILVVDDDPETCILLKDILNAKNYTVGIACNGEKAITLVQKNAYDIIFIDLKLPTINGLETYLRIKKIKPEIVAIIMTAYCEEMTELVNSAIENNAYTCLYKPLDIEKLLNLVDEIMKKKHLRKKRRKITIKR